MPHDVMTMQPLTTAQFGERVGAQLGVSAWMLVDQDRIDRFADATEDWQFIHVDPMRAKATPLGTTVAHGFLTTSLLAGMLPSAVPEIVGSRMALNYGMNNLRFLTPVKSGQRVRGLFTLKDFTEKSPGQWLTTLAVSVEIDGEPKPALVAEMLVLTLL